MKYNEIMEQNKQFDLEFEEYKIENPDWEKYLTDSTFYELMDWYDFKHGLGCEEHASEEAHDFAKYIWSKIVDERLPEMSVHPQIQGGYGIVNMSEDDLRSLLTMIKGACLLERRHWNGIKQKIEKMIE